MLTVRPVQNQMINIFVIRQNTRLKRRCLYCDVYIINERIMSLLEYTHFTALSCKLQGIVGIFHILFMYRGKQFAKRTFLYLFFLQMMFVLKKQKPYIENC